VSSIHRGDFVGFATSSPEELTNEHASCLFVNRFSCSFLVDISSVCFCADYSHIGKCIRLSVVATVAFSVLTITPAFSIPSLQSSLDVLRTCDSGGTRARDLMIANPTLSRCATTVQVEGGEEKEVKEERGRPTFLYWRRIPYSANTAKAVLLFRPN